MGVLQFLVAPLSFTGPYRALGGGVGGDQTCVDTDGRRLQRLEGGCCFFLRLLKLVYLMLKPPNVGSDEKNLRFPFNGRVNVHL